MQEADPESAGPSQSQETEAEREMEDADTESAGPSQSQETEEEREMQKGDQDLAGPSNTWEPHQTFHCNLSLAQRSSSSELKFLGEEMTEKQWILFTENMHERFTIFEAHAKCKNILSWVKKASSTEVVPALDLSMDRDLPWTPSSSSSSTSSSWSSVVINVADLGAASTCRSIRFSLGPSHGPSEVANPRTGASTRNPTPFPSPIFSEESLGNEEEDDNLRKYCTASEDRDREDWDRPRSDPLRSVFGLSHSFIFSQVHRDAHRSLSEVILPSIQRRPKKMRPIILSADTRLIMAIVEIIIKQINASLAQIVLKGCASQGAEAPSTSISSLSSQFAEQMLRIITTTMNGHIMGQMALTRLSGKSPLEIESRLETELGPLAGQVIVATISSIQRAKSDAQTGHEVRVSSPCTYFLSAVSAEVQSLVVQRSGTRMSARQSGSNHLLNLSQAKITRAVELKMAEMYGGSLWDWSLTEQNIQPGHDRITAMSSDLVDLVLDDTLDALGYLENQALSGPQSVGYRNGIEGLDIDGVARDMVRKAAVKLKASMSELELEVGSRSSQGSSGPSNHSPLSRSHSDPRMLCVWSAAGVRTVLQVLKTELDSNSDESFDPLQMARNLLARLASGVKSIDNLEIGKMLQGTSAIMEPEAVREYPEISSTAIYHSLLIDCPFPPSERVQETIILSHPLTAQDVTTQRKKQHSADLQTDSLMAEYPAKAQRVVTQVIRDSPLTVDILSAHVSSKNIAEASTHVLESLLVDLNEAVEVSRAERSKFWEQVQLSSQKLYSTAVDKLKSLYTGCLLNNERDHQDTHVTADKIQDMEVSTNNDLKDPTVAVSQELVRHSAKKILTKVLNVIKAGVAGSEHSSVGEQMTEECQVATEMLDSILNRLEDDEPDVGEEDHLHVMSVRDIYEDVSSKTSQVCMVMSSQAMDALTDDVSAATYVHDIVYRSESCLSQATSTHRSGTSQASSDLVVEYMSELHANCLDTALPVRCTSTAVGDTETCHVPSARVKKKSQGRRFSCCPKLPTVRIKVFKGRVEPESHPAQKELPSQRFSTSRVALYDDHAVPIIPQLEDDLPPAPAQESRKRPLFVRMFRAISRAISKPFKGCAFCKKN
ncbi:uncharacterized protein LOC109891905 isoform X1 [Oncorhynchus kisutch]|uniref:uncharacterized protein LOC109891905 isoform X1 n=1 Tax=Oncorhynchus kisutch TaxID=8019 RepID=UPI0012DC7369|nr:uncharacterized protein LOC109891905 isoform X1 [Oncorhynchus kisutch]